MPCNIYNIQTTLTVRTYYNSCFLLDGAPCSFFCRMKCPKFKMAMCAAKSPGYKVRYVIAYSVHTSVLHA